MTDNLFTFQHRAVDDLRRKVMLALSGYRLSHAPQVVSFTAPTGSGKTIIISALIEDIFYGTEQITEQPNAIFVWLSDSPQLNDQSRHKIDTKADRIRLSQCVTIDEESFDREMLEDGHIYFLNTQKIGKSGNLTKHSDRRQYTIWETLSNTVREKSDRLYFVIDEAHRGMHGNDAGKATSIMQKFIKGSEKDGLPPMPVVIGMSATTERFDKLVEGTTSSIHKVVVTANEVRSSGLLKDRIIITYPEDVTAHNDMAILQAATDEWIDKSKHWHQYTTEQHYPYVNPILVIQVQNGIGDNLTETNLDDCLAKIEERCGYRFKENEVVHSFGQAGTISVNGLDVHHVVASEIAEDRRIRIVFFKENLSTGWDCPRAETMMSFRHAEDATYIAQLLGRMIRTPLQMRVKVDESLNDVHLYLPYYNAETVQSIIDSLQAEEGGEIPAFLEEESYENPNFRTWTIRPSRRSHHTPGLNDADRISIFDIISDDTPTDELFGGAQDGNSNLGNYSEIEENLHGSGYGAGTVADSPADNVYADNCRSEVQGSNDSDNEPVPEQFSGRQLEITGYDIDRDGIVKFINDLAIPTYDVRDVRIHDYLTSLLKLVRLLSQANISSTPLNDVKNDMVEMIHEYVGSLKQRALYDAYSRDVLEFKLASKVYDPFGEAVNNYTVMDLIGTSDEDLDRQLMHADRNLGGIGIANEYGRKYFDDDNPNSFKIDTILFAADEECMTRLKSYAKDRFHSLNDEYRRLTVSLNERYRKQYNDIISDGDPVSEHNFRVPEELRVRDEAGKEYDNHLFVDEDTGTARIRLNSWEEGVLDEEQRTGDFVSWIRNPSRGSWALTLHYEYDGVQKPMYPDFIIIRSDVATGYAVDILEPHMPSLRDNLGKAKALAEYARKNPILGRVQLIREGRDSLGNKRFKRLDMGKSAIREKVQRAMTNDELDHIFEDDGFFKDDN